MRAELDAWLADLHPGATDRYAALVAVSELVTNVVEHAYVDRAEVDGGRPDRVRARASSTTACSM